jgi:Cd2+/Zn2+-exporting ATPase
MQGQRMNTDDRLSCGTAACESLNDRPLVAVARPLSTTVLYIEKMDCPIEERQIRHRLRTIEGIESLHFDLQAHKLEVEHRLASLDPVTTALAELGMPAIHTMPATGPQRTRLRVARMDCRNEEREIRERLGAMPGVQDLQFDLQNRVLTVQHQAPLQEITDALSALGMPAEVDPQGSGFATEPSMSVQSRAGTFLPSPELAAGSPAQSAIPFTAHTASFRIDKMDCPTEEALIRKRLEGIPGVGGLEFNLMQRKLTVQHGLQSTEPIVDALRSIGLPPAAANGTAGRRTVYRIENMDCPTEEALIRDKLQNMEGVQELDFNLMQRKLTVTHTVQPAAVEQALDAIGMKAVVDSGSPHGDEVGERPAVTGRQWALMALAGLSAAAAEGVAFTIGQDRAWPVLALAIVSIITGGWPTYKKGWLALRSGILNMNALMSIAVTGAILIGQWPEAAMVMFLFALAEIIEVLSLDRARNAIRGLLAMAPELATVQQPDGRWQEVPAKSVAVGQLVRIRPGEKIPLDGVLVSGQSAVNQAPITGESIPVAKTAGDPVFAGTLNESGSFEYRVNAEATHSTLARIIKAVEEAQGSRAPTQRFVDQFARIYTPAVFVVAIAVAVLPPLLAGGAWMDWIYKALVLLVIACPCALVISTPVTVVSGLATAARRGILIKGGAYLEQGRLLKALALDKTGTITQGRPVVTDVVALDPASDALRLAASLAVRSDHPVSGAVAAYWQQRHGSEALLGVDAFEAMTGRGVNGRIGGLWYYLGNRRLLQELRIASPQAEDALKQLEGAGKTAIVLADESSALAVLGVADTVRETSRDAIAQLHALGVQTLMLTGDNQQTASAIARNVGIDDARGGLLPEDKLKAVEEAIGRYQTVGMVGDGINDAPALAKANIGFAMGAAGTDTAIETADVALMDDDLRKVPQFIRLSRRTGSILKQNIVVALGTKAVFFALALLGMATLWMAVFADMGASLLVVFNGLRLLKSRTA